MNDEKSPERIAYKKAWREAHREQERAAQRESYRVWREANPLPVKPKKVKVVRKRYPSDARKKANKRDNLNFVVYVIKAGDHVKVGIAENVETRVRVFRTHCPLPVVLAYYSKPMLRPEARRIELECHAHLIENHAHGEWFLSDVSVAISFLKVVTGHA